MTLEWVTTLTELKISTFLASSSVSQATDFFSLPGLSHGIELNAQVNFLHLSMVSGERWVCSVSSFPGMGVVSVGVAPCACSQPAAWLTGSTQAPFFWKRSGREMSPSVAHLQAPNVAGVLTTRRGAVPKLLLLGNCLDKCVYPFRERHTAPLHPNDHTSFILPAAVPQNTLCSNG